ncbi:MAG: YggS family pyridoxal phosphate-dependent enzyme [bacterium]|nr:YggS family pyridoxal phosphate-dependent enzyme [bacterium]
MSIEDNYQKIKDNITRACQRVGRDPSEVTIMGVAKAQPSRKIQEAFDCGIHLIGENKTQEAEIHQEELNSLDGIKWHFIGKLQKNKINRILRNFDFIQSVDGVKSLEHIHKRVSDVIEVFIEINIGDEKNKSGFTVDGLKKALNYIATLDRVKITGLMTIPPMGEDPEDVRPYFRDVRELKDQINGMNLPTFDIRHLSMGMTADYEIAVEEGATIVRIGTALFGRRLK